MPHNQEIKTALVERRPARRQALTALIAGSPGVRCAGDFDSVEAARQRLDLYSPEVLLLGLTPQDDAVGAVGLLKDRFPALQILVLAELANEDEILATLAAGASGFLLADTLPARLLEAIAELAAGGAPMTPRIARIVVQSLQRTRVAPASGSRLSRRERETLRLLAAGHSYKTAAAELGLSVDTVRFHVRNIYGKLHVHSKVEAVLAGSRDGLLG